MLFDKILNNIINIHSLYISYQNYDKNKNLYKLGLFKSENVDLEKTWFGKT